MYCSDSHHSQSFHFLASCLQLRSLALQILQQNDTSLLILNHNGIDFSIHEAISSLDFSANA